MNLVRMGHYHTPGELGEVGMCETAFVCGHDAYGDARENQVNIRVYSHRGEDRGNQMGVPLMGHEFSDEPSFHLSTDCPYDPKR